MATGATTVPGLVLLQCGATGTSDTTIIGTISSLMASSTADPPSPTNLPAATATNPAGSHSSASAQNLQRRMNPPLPCLIGTQR